MTKAFEKLSLPAIGSGVAVSGCINLDMVDSSLDSHEGIFRVLDSRVSLQVIKCGPGKNRNGLPQHRWERHEACTARERRHPGIPDGLGRVGRIQSGFALLQCRVRAVAGNRDIGAFEPDAVGKVVIGNRQLSHCRDAAKGSREDQEAKYCSFSDPRR